MNTKRLGLLVFLAASSSLSTFAQQNDPVIMTVAGKPVLRSEFEYSYKKNNGDDVIDRKTVKEYSELFANYKRKVQAALDAHLDTLTSYNKEFRQYRDQQVLPTLITENDVENEAHRLYNLEKESIGPDGLVAPSHILFYIGQNPEEGLMEKQKQRADSAYQALVKGADFAELAKSVSQDPGSATNGGAIGWIKHGQTLENFDKTAFSLQPGEFSKPVLTEVGYHIIKVNERKQMESYEELRSTIMDFIERRKIREVIAQNRLKDIAAEKQLSEQQVMDLRSDSISAIDQDMKYLIQEYHDGLLLYEISNREVWDKAAKDEKGLEAFWKKNKKKYSWDEPRFKGMAYRTREAADIEAVKACVKGKKFGDWAQLLRTTFNNDSVLRIRVEKGIFKKGDNGIVDRNEYGIADAKIKDVKGFPNTASYGKMLNAPEEMSDVRTLVVADYQDAMEKEWVKTLKAKYPVVINEEILATVKE